MESINLPIFETAVQTEPRIGRNALSRGQRLLLFKAPDLAWRWRNWKVRCTSYQAAMFQIQPGSGQYPA